MAESENYMQQVNAQYQASRKRRQQRFSSNVVNSTDSQGMMDRLQGSDVGGFSGGGSDEGIVPMTIATGGTPATTAGYSGKPGGTPASQAGWLRDTVEGAMGGRQNSGGNCPGGQCGIPRGTTVASMPTTTGPHPEFDDYEGRLKQAYNDGMGARAYGDASEQGIRTQRSVYDTNSAYAARNHASNYAVMQQDLLNAPVAFAAQKQAADIANAGAQQAQDILHAGTPGAIAKYRNGLQESLAFSGLTVPDYAEQMADHEISTQPRVGPTGGGEAMEGQGHVKAERVAYHTNMGNKIVVFGLYHTLSKAPQGKTEEQNTANLKEQTDLLMKLRDMPKTYTGDYPEYIRGTVYPQALETLKSLHSQGVDPEDTAKMLVATEAAAAQALKMRDTLLLLPPAKTRTMFEYVNDSIRGKAEPGDKKAPEWKPPMSSPQLR